MSAPRVAVVIPCFNLGKFVSTAVRSAQNQGIAVEIVVIDDGSTDSDTHRELDQLQARGITVLRTENRGLAAARNLGVSSTAAPLLCMLDADDVLAPGYFKSAIDLLDRDIDLAFVSCWLQTFGERSWQWRQDSCALQDLLDECTVCTAAIVHRSAVEAVGGFDEKMPIPGYEDWDFWISLVERGYRGAILQEVFFFYRQRPHSMSETCCAPEGHATLSRYLIEKHRNSFEHYVVPLLVRKIHRECDLLKRTYALETQSVIAEMPMDSPKEPAASLGAHDEAAALRASLSWRITAPLRAAYELARAPFGFFRGRP